MRTLVSQVLRGNGLFERLIRSIGWSTFGFGAEQIIRLGSNLIFARLLFPEAFGLMALVSVVLIGLTMFSDIGIGSSIMQSKRGDDPAFLDTAWTLQVMRGFILWLGTCAVAWPVANFYGEPQLAQLIPVAGLTLLIAGFNPTQIVSSNRHLMLGRVVVLELASQCVSTVVMVALVWATRSVWALVIGAVVGSLTKLALAHLFLPNSSNRLLWEQQSVRDILHFGKWLFFSTGLGFLISQGDKAILGKYLSLDMLGVYNIGYFLASAPMLLGVGIVGRTLIPLYRERHPSASADNFRKIRLLRFGFTSGILSIVLALAFCGVWLVGLLYDPRYSAAGAIVVMVAGIQIIQVIGMTYDQAFLAAGDSRSFFFLFAAKAVIQVTLLLVGVELGGLVGMLVGQGIALLVVHFLIIALARRHGVWDPLHDAFFSAIGFSLGAIALWIHRDAISTVMTFGTQ